MPYQNTITYHSLLDDFETHLQAFHGNTYRAARQRKSAVHRLLSLVDLADAPGTATQSDLVLAVRRLRDTAIKPNTARAYVTSIKAFYRWAYDMGHLDSDPGRNLPLPPGERVRPVAYQPSEVRSLFSACSSTRWPTISLLLLSLGFFMGLRRSEMLRLSVTDVVHRNGQPSALTVTGKNGKRREVPLPDVMIPLLSRYLEERSAWLARRSVTTSSLLISTGSVRHPALGYDGIGLAYRRLAKLAGVHDRGLVHAARRTFATVTLASGTHPVVLSEICGWSNPATALHYLVVDSDTQRDSLNANPLHDVLADPDDLAA